MKVPGLPLGGLDVGLPLYWSHRPFHPPSLLTVSPLALLGGGDRRDKGSSSGLGVLMGGGSNVDCLGGEVILWVHQSAPLQLILYSIPPPLCPDFQRKSPGRLSIRVPLSWRSAPFGGVHS